MQALDYLQQTSITTQKLLRPLLDYIASIEGVQFDENHTQQSHTLTWRKNDIVLGVGCRKHYVSIYFNHSQAASIVGVHTSYVRVLKKCVNITYKRTLPLEAIKRVLK